MLINRKFGNTCCSELPTASRAPARLCNRFAEIDNRRRAICFGFQKNVSPVSQAGLLQARQLASAVPLPVGQRRRWRLIKQTRRPVLVWRRVDEL